MEEAGAGNPQYFNLVNPPFRDVFNTRPMLQQTVWVVVRYQVVNPGPWPFHCHIQTHLQGGMALSLWMAWIGGRWCRGSMRWGGMGIRFQSWGDGMGWEEHGKGRGGKTWTLGVYILHYNVYT